MWTRSMPMHPASEAARPDSGEGPAAPAESRTTLGVSVDANVTVKRRSPSQRRSTTVGGLADIGRFYRIPRPRRRAGALPDRSARPTRNHAAHRKPGKWQRDEKVREVLTVLPIWPIRFSCPVQRFTAREQIGLSELVEAVDDELQNEHEQKDGRDLEEEPKIHAVSVPRPEPGHTGREQRPGRGANDHRHRLHLKQQRAHEQRRLHSLARDHEQREAEHAKKRRRALLEG